MINEDMYALGAAPNKIREIFAYGLERKAQIGDDKVFDLSIGNPSVPSPAIVGYRFYIRLLLYHLYLHTLLIPLLL